MARPGNQMAEEAQVEQVRMSDLNQQIPGGKRGLYNTLKFKGHHLPDYTSKCISIEYLLGVANNKYYSQLTKDIKLQTCYKQIPAAHMMADLKDNIQPFTWGFTAENCPNFEWFAAIAGSLKSDHKIFKPKEAHEIATLVELPKK